MKKRILALMMTGVMLVGCPVMALAEEAAEDTEVMEEGSEEIESLDSTMIDETVYEEHGFPLLMYLISISPVTGMFWSMQI